jgi:hypothetical protein
VNRTDLTPHLEALDPVPSTPLVGKPTPEPQEFSSALEACTINPDLTAEERGFLVQVISSFPMAFAHGSHQLGDCPDDAMVIEVDLPTPTPPLLRKAAYPISPRSRADMDVALDDLLSCGIIRPSRSQYASPAIMTYLKGKPRMCVDYRALNAFTIPISYPMPRIAESLSLLQGAKYISCLDANKASIRSVWLLSLNLLPPSRPPAAYSNIHACPLV